MSSRWSDRLRPTLGWRLGLWYAGLFVASAVALSVGTYLLLARALAAQDHDVLQSMLSRYAAAYEQSGLAGLRQLIEADAREGRHERLLVRVMNDRAEVVYFATPPGWSAFDLSSLDRHGARREGWASLDYPADRAVLEIGTVDLKDGVAVQVGRTSHVRDALLRNYRARALEVGTLIVLIAVAGGALLTAAGLAPLRAMDATLRGILRTGRLDARVETRGTRDPLDELGALVNEMLGRIEALVSGMKGALDNVAHDLRTPLTRLRNVAESAVVAGDPAAMREGLARALEEAGRVNATLTALMDISEAETGTMKLARERVRLADVVGEAVALFADEADDKGVVLDAQVPASIELWADRTRLRQVLANLIENGVKYTDARGRVDIEAHADVSTVTIAVRDTGVGIDAEHLPFVWQRLYRADSSRSARGLGLGLSLVKAIVEAHGGHVDAASVRGAGSTFSIVLPIGHQVAAGAEGR